MVPTKEQIDQLDDGDLLQAAIDAIPDYLAEHMPSYPPTFEACYINLKSIIENRLRDLGMCVVSIAIADEQEGTHIQIGAIIPREDEPETTSVPRTFG